MPKKLQTAPTPQDDDSSSGEDMPTEVSMKGAFKSELSRRKVAPVRLQKKKVNNKVKKALAATLDSQELQRMAKKERRLERLT